MTPPPAAPVDPSEQARRLERRLAREREARRQAEEISERSLRDLYREQNRLALVETIATAANLGDDPGEAFDLALRSICAFTGWSLGQAYMFADDAEDGPLIWSGVWHDLAPRTRDAFRQVSTTARFQRGEGLPGRVWESGKASWIEDVAKDSSFPRADIALACGLRGAFAFPALIGEEVGAVLEFFAEHPAPPDDVLLRTLDQIGAQLGRVIERYRNARRHQAHAAALEAEKAAAEQASRAKSAFLAVTSHEIRTPLNAVLGLAEALKREPLTERQHGLNDGVLASGTMLLRLLNAVLDMSKIEADRAVVEMSDFDLGAKLKSIVSIWTPRAEETGVALGLEVVDLGLTRVRSDEGRLEQTLVNLVSNALKFTPAGGSVTVRAASSGDRLRVEVIDSGGGVPEEARERIFKPFEQTEAGRQAGGAGLGLAICAGNIGLLDGTIGCRRGSSGGECFWFEIPIGEAIETPAATQAEPAPRRGADRPLRILAAEDNPANQRVLTVLLEPSGAQLTLAENGQEAVDALEREAFDLVLMDANMPVMDGIEAVRLIRAREGVQRICIHMLTANAFAEDVERYMAAGADGVLTKPIQLPQLYAVLDACAETIIVADAA